MKLKDVLTVAALGGLVFFGYRYQKSREAEQAAAAAKAASARAAKDEQANAVTEVIVTQAPPAAQARDDASIRMLIDEGAKGTYIRDMLAADPLLARWPEHRTEGMRVWIERRSDVENWNPQYPLVAERVFDQWREAGFPVFFDVQPDSAGAVIQIRWTKKLVEGGRQIGITRKTRDQNGWIVRAEIEIATFDGLGHALTPETVGGVARHEVGHALGLGHSSSPNDVMYPESTTPIISAADRATLHLLYMLPPGAVK